MKILKIVLIVSALILSNNANSAIVYNESISGDFSDALWNYQTQSVTLETGINSITGSMFVELNNLGSPDGKDLDVVSFYITEGLYISDITLISSINYDSTLGSNGTWRSDIEFYNIDSGYNLINIADNLFLGGTENLFSGNLPLYSNNYMLSFNHNWITYDTTASYTYLITVDGAVATVPVPAAVWLFGSGLIGLVVFARRKKA